MSRPSSGLYLKPFIKPGDIFGEAFAGEVGYYLVGELVDRLRERLQVQGRMGWFWGRSGKASGGGEKGFTLIELLIVIAILGIIAVVVVPAVGTFVTTAEVAAANTEASNVKTAILSYLADNDEFPATSALLTVPEYLSSTLIYGDPYTFDTTTGRISDVTETAKVPSGYSFKESTQLWEKD